ncbi:MFS general substrate transporter [Linnemannia elongata AG-77]|uniref:MFS general substrate transporter n=1 Tax=Linnemannia elongata AG-77 TaxID=1314771 RepID=A0A197JI75_9FUNG|nr:MFS general substrate transporter [Linnemannia elongata AG-77]
MTDKQEYAERLDNPSSKITGSDHSGSATNIGGPGSGVELSSSKLERTTSMDHQNRAQASLDVEMAKARISKSEPPSRRWIVLATATLGALFVSLQGSALIVALPDLMRDLDIDFATIIWVLLTYTLAITATVPLLGYIGDAGLKGIRCRMFNIGFFVFTLGSLLCGLAQRKYNGYDLLGYRVVQGLGGALLFSNCFAIVADKFYPYNQVGLASGIINIAFAAGTILGPVIGGATVKASWKWVFFFNLPFGALGTLAGFLFCHDTIYSHVEYATVRKLAPTFDYTGFISLTITLILLFVVVVSALFPNGKVSENSSLIGMGVAMGVLFIVFIIQQTFVRGGKRYNPAKAPFMDFNLFKNWVFNNTVVLGGLAGGVARTNLTFSFIFFFQGPYSKDPLMAGILLIPFGLGIMIAGMPAGRLADVIGFRYLCTAGLALASLATLIMPLVIKPETNTWAISALLLVNGLGWGLYQSPSASISMLCILPQQRSASSSLRIMFTMLSQMIAIVICFKVIISGMPPEAVQELFIYGGGIDAMYLSSFMHGWKIVCWITFAITLVCCVCSWGLPVQPVMAKPEPESEGTSVADIEEVK